MECEPTEWPDDFIPATNVVKPTDDDPTPIDDRFRNHLAAIDKRTKTEKNVQGQNELRGVSMSEFESRLRKLRVATVKWGAPRIEAIFVESLNRKYPDLRWNDKKIASSADFCQWIKKGPFDNYMHGVVAFATGEMWGDNNQWAINLEIEYHSLLRVKCTGVLSNGKRPKKSHKGNCSAAVFVKGKGSLVGKIRNCCKRRWKEAVYCRTEKPKIAEKELEPEDDQEDQATDTKKDKKNNKIPKLLMQEEATEETHGFHGYLGKCAGHPDLLQKTPAAADVIGCVVSPGCTAASFSSVSGEKHEMTEVEKWLHEHGSIKTLEDMCGALLDQRLDTPQKDMGGIEPRLLEDSVSGNAHG